MSRESTNMKTATECSSTVSDSLMWDTGWENTAGDLMIRRPKAQDCSSFFEMKLTVRKPSTGSTVGKTGDDGGQELKGKDSEGVKGRG